MGAYSTPQASVVAAADLTVGHAAAKLWTATVRKLIVILQLG
jgi:hypothetical protein